MTNRGAEPAELLLWAVGASGWDAVPAAARLAPGESCVLECPLRETFPDGTPKIDPGRVPAVELILPGRPRGPRGRPRLGTDLMAQRAVRTALELLP